MMHPYQGGPLLPSPSTLRGVPLEPGEKVVYFHSSKNIGLRVLMFFLGIPLVPILIGIAFLVSAFTDQSDLTAITTRRFIRKSGKKPVETLGLRDVAKTESVHGLRARLTEMRLFDATGRFVSVSFTSDEKLKPLVRSLLEDPSIVDSMPAVPYEP